MIFACYNANAQFYVLSSSRAQELTIVCPIFSSSITDLTFNYSLSNINLFSEIPFQKT